MTLSRPALTLICCLAMASGAWAQSWSVVKEENDPSLRIYCDGLLVTKYHHEGVDRPFFHPVIGPTGEPLTRGFPMAPAEGEPTDHPHHRSLWFAHRGVNGIDFWSEPAAADDAPVPGTSANGEVKFGRIRHTGFGSMKMGSNPATFTVRNDWVGPDGRKVCEDVRVHTFAKTADGGYVWDWDVTVKATAGPVTFSDTEEGTLALRLANGLCLVGGPNRDVPGTGGFLTSEGVRGREVWGRRASWLDAFGPDRNGQTVGVAVFDHPGNLRHPTWWHARDYGLVAANPFGLRSFEKKDKPEGEFAVMPGGMLRFRYRLYLHRGTPEEAGVGEAYAAYAREAES
jgi:hypothetical protein